MSGKTDIASEPNRPAFPWGAAAFHHLSIGTALDQTSLPFLGVLLPVNTCPLSTRVRLSLNTCPSHANVHPGIFEHLSIRRLRLDRLAPGDRDGEGAAAPTHQRTRRAQAHGTRHTSDRHARPGTRRHAGMQARLIVLAIDWHLQHSIAAFVRVSLTEPFTACSLSLFTEPVHCLFT